MNARIAIPFAEDRIFPHFGKSTQFKIYTIEEDRIVSAEVLATDGAGHEILGLWLVQHGVNAVICGNIGPGALGALRAAGIPACAGVEGSPDDAIAHLLAGTLVAAETPTCPGHGGGCHGGGCHGGCHGGGGCHGCH